MKGPISLQASRLATLPFALLAPAFAVARPPKRGLCTVRECGTDRRSRRRRGKMSGSAARPGLPAALGVFCLLVALAGCATLPTNFKQPGVTVVSITPRVLNSMTPEFDILLRVSNPNRSALDIAGMTYQVRIADRKLVEGAANELPRIEAYGEEDVSLRARADLFGALDLLTRLLENPGVPVDYEFSAEIDIGALYPTVRVERAGSFAP